MPAITAHFQQNVSPQLSTPLLLTADTESVRVIGIEVSVTRQLRCLYSQRRASAPRIGRPIHERPRDERFLFVSNFLLCVPSFDGSGVMVLPLSCFLAMENGRLPGERCWPNLDRRGTTFDIDLRKFESRSNASHPVTPCLPTIITWFPTRLCRLSELVRLLDV